MTNEDLYYIIATYSSCGIGFADPFSALNVGKRQGFKLEESGFGMSFVSKVLYVERRKPVMKYIAPEMKALAFAAEEAISAPLEGSTVYNDAELEW